MPWYNPWSPPDPPKSPSEPSTTLSKLRDAAQEKTSTLRTQTTNTISTLKSDLDLPTTTSDLTTSLTSPSTLLSTAILTTLILSLTLTYRRFLRRIPTATAIPDTYILPRTNRFTRSLFGPVTAVTDADNFRLFHTPLGRLGLWGWVRTIPTKITDLRNNTIHIRLAGIDAPELSHFGRPAQPYSKEAMEWLTAYLSGRRVRCYCRRKDQYGRVVATVYVRRWLVRRDVGLEMLRSGWAGVYEAKTGVEFGGERVEREYRRVEEIAKRKGRGMWGGSGGKLESPREYKNKYRDGGNAGGGS